MQSFPQFTPEFFRPELKVAFLGFLAKVALAEFSRVFAFCKIGNEMRCGVGLRESKDDKVLLTRITWNLQISPWFFRVVRESLLFDKFRFLKKIFFSFLKIGTQAFWYI